MSNKRKKYIALLISLIMLFDFVPLSVFSEEAVVVDKSESQTAPVLLDPEDGTSDEEEFWEEVISEHIDDYTVTVTVTKEAEFPIGTTVTITPLSSGAYRNEAANLFDQNDNKLGSFIRVFDITFWYDDMEIEPLVPVDVKVTFDNAVELEGNNELKLIHLHEDEEAKEISAETETTQTEDSEAIESLSFQSDKFSTYIVAEEIVVYTFSESGNNYEVVLKVNSAMGLPQDAVFTVDEITKDSDLYDQYAAQVAAVINPDGAVRMPALLDISLKTADGEKIQLDNKVQVIVRLTDEDVKRGLQVVHFPGEDPFQGESAVRDAVANNDNIDEIEVLDIESERLYPRLNTKENTVTFNTDSFSVFALAYTVDFTYEDLNGSLHIDFTGYDVLAAEEESPIVYDTAECDIHVSTEWLSSLLRQAAEPTEGITVETEINGNFRFNFASAEETEAIGGVRYADGGLAITADGSVCLTDGKRNLTVSITNLSVLKEEILEAEGVKIQVEEGNVPIGSEARYTIHSEEETAELVETFNLAEDQEDIVGFNAADLTIVCNEEEVSAEGLFIVAVDKNTLVPAGMKIEKLYHIHNEEVEELAVTETEDGQLEFELANFSDIVAGYTVDFDYEGIQWSFPGFGRYAISEILSQIDVEGEIESVELLLIEGEEVEGALYLDQDEEDVWYLCSDVPFDEVYRLTIIVDGATYILTVTDEEYWNVTVNLFDYDGSSAATSEEISTLSGKTYGIIAILENEAGAPIGYNKSSIGITFSNSVATCSIGKQSFKTLTWPSWWNEGEAGSIQPNDPSVSKIKFRLYEDTCELSAWQYKSFGNIIELPDSMTGFEFLPDPNGNIYDGTSVIMNLKRAYDKQFNIRFNIDPAGLKITDDDQYYALITVNHATTGTTYSWQKITIPQGATTKDFVITEWYNGSGSLLANEKFTGNETVTVQIYTTNPGPDGTKSGFDGISSFMANQTKVLVAEGNPMNMYNLYYGTITDEDDDVNHIKNYYYNLILRAPDGNISKGDIDRLLEDATDFGYYTLEYIGQSGDIEATIGAAIMDTEFTDGFGYSSANVNVNRLKVLKIYTDNLGNPVSKEVTIRLKQNNEIVAQKTGTTSAVDGTLELEFDGLNSGVYEIEEVIDGKVVTGTGHAEIEGETVYYNFSINEAHFANNKNVNYFGVLGPNQNVEKLKTMLSKASRVDVVILVDNETEKAKVEQAKKEGNYGSSQIDVYVKGTNGYKSYDIVSDMVKLKQLSDDLANAQSSSTVRIVNMKASEISEEGLSFDDDGRYIVINIEMDQQAFCPQVKLGGQLLDCDYGQSGKSNSSHVLYNLRRNGTCYDGLFDTTKLGAGVILAPAANAHVLGGPFGGTIISAKVNRSGNELHSNNPNQIQTLNATIQNIIGKPNTGSLELRKEFAETSIKDKITYFSFEVTLNNTDMTLIANKSFPASGLKKGKSVTFDSDGKAVVLVRAGNSVTISSLPKDTSFTVAEIVTPETQHFMLDHIEVDGSEADSGTIAGGTTSKVRVVNTLKTTEFTIVKEVKGITDDTKEFEFKLVLENNTGTEENPVWVTYPDEYTVTIAGTTETVPKGQAGPYTFRLKAGQRAEINKLKVDTSVIRYTVTETAVIDNGDYKPVIDGRSTYGYSNEEPEKTGTYTVAGERVLFVNYYKAETKIQIIANKVLQGRTLAENEFTFELRENSPTGPVIGTVKTNAANGSVTFDEIQYKIDYTGGTVIDSMAGAVQKINGTREKTFTYYVCEVRNPDVTDIAYAEPVEVIIKVVDDGKGNLYAYDEEWNLITEYTEGELTNYTYTLPVSKDVVNRVMIEKTLTGTKTMAGRDMDDNEVFEFIVKENETEVSRGTASKGAGNTVNVVFQPIVYSYDPAATYPVTHVYTITEDNSKLLEDVQENSQVFYAKVTVNYDNETKNMTATDPEYSTDNNTWVTASNVAFTNTGETIGFEVTKDWRNLEDTEILDTSASVLLRISRKDGKPFMLKDSQWKNKNGKGTVTSVEPVLDLVTQALVDAGLMDQPARENLIKLQPDSTGWPVVAFMNLPKATYVVEEVNCKLDDSGSATADVETTYVLDSDAGTSAAPDITTNGSSLVIRNNETTDNLKVTKNFVLPDGSFANDIAKKDPIYFAVRLNHSEDGSWNSYYNNSHAAEVNSVPLYTINWDETNQTWTTVTIGTIPAKYEGRPVLSYSILEMTAEGAEKTTDANLLDIKYYKNYGKSNAAAITSIEQGQGGLITIENMIPVPRYLTVTKQWTDENGDPISALTNEQKTVIYFKLKVRNKTGNTNYSWYYPSNENPQLFSFTGHTDASTGTWVWDPCVIRDLPLTVYDNEVVYFIEETNSSGVSIEDGQVINGEKYIPLYVDDHGNEISADHPIDPANDFDATIKNQKRIPLRVTKRLLNENGVEITEDPTPNSFYFVLYKHYSGYNTAVEKDDNAIQSIVWDSVNNKWSEVIYDDLPVPTTSNNFTYMVKEVKAADDGTWLENDRFIFGDQVYDISYEHKDGNTVVSTPVTDPYGQMITIVNRPAKTLKVTKEWLDADEIQKTFTENKTIYYSIVNAEDTSEKLTGAYSADRDSETNRYGDSVTTFSITYDATKHEWSTDSFLIPAGKKYKVVETDSNGNILTAGSGYKISYQYSNAAENARQYVIKGTDSTVTIVNRDNGPLEVTKSWLNGYGLEESFETDQTVYFVVIWYHHDSGWKEPIGTNGRNNGTPFELNYSAADNTWSTARIPADYTKDFNSSNGDYLYIQETYSNGNYLDDSSLSYTIRYYDQDGQAISSSNGFTEPEGTVITIVNADKDTGGKLRLEKVWKNTEGITLTAAEAEGKTATVELWKTKRHFANEGSNAAITINRQSATTQYSDGTNIKVGDKIQLVINDGWYVVSNSVTVNGQHVDIDKQKDTYVFTLSFLVPSQSVAISYTGSGGTVESATKLAISDTPAKVRDITLNSTNNWQWKDDMSVVVGTDYADYEYYFVETLPATGYDITYSVEYAGEGNRSGSITSGAVTVYNQEQEHSSANINVLKQDATDQHALSGAKFKLYSVVTPAGGGTPTETPYNDSTGVNEKTTGIDGTIQFTELPDGSYKLVETQAPAGYVALNSAIAFTITNGVVSYGGTGSTVTYDSMNNTFTVGNTPGVELPATGGPGTALYTFLGLMIIQLAGGLLVLNRRRGFRENK